jgi:hypothetical protein
MSKLMRPRATDRCIDELCRTCMLILVRVSVCMRGLSQLQLLKALYTAAGLKLLGCSCRAKSSPLELLQGCSCRAVAAGLHLQGCSCRAKMYDFNGRAVAAGLCLFQLNCRAVAATLQGCIPHLMASGMSHLQHQHRHTEHVTNHARQAVQVQVTDLTHGGTCCVCKCMFGVSAHGPKPTNHKP